MTKHTFEPSSLSASPYVPSYELKPRTLRMASLKSFIKSVRAAKTLNEERTVIQKQSAKIRSAFRDERITASARRENIAKLLYLFTLGERTHFGQVECVKLLASPHFVDKRLGYLGTMLLLDENQEVLMLVTNSLDSDLQHPNQYVICLALTTLANIASSAMARDLFHRVEKLMGSSNPFIKRKAALCALRIVRKVPEFEEIFVAPAKTLIRDTNHGVLLGAAALVTDMVDNNPELVEQFAEILPSVIAQLKQLSSSGFSSEYNVGGISDPFLQCALIKLLRALGQDNEELSEKMGDILAMIATNTDNSKNVGNAILYECVLTIFGIETGPPLTDSGLRVLGINILAKFLTTKNMNTRYSALNTLLRVVELEPAAVQRHRQTILDCVYDQDVSIRRRALDLSYVLINAENVRFMVKELLVVLESCDVEFKSQLVFQIALNAERFAPTVRWHVDTLLRLLELAGNFTKENVLSAVILLVISAPDLQLYATRHAYRCLRQSFAEEGMNIVGLWLIGEYGDLLVKNGPFTPEGASEAVPVGCTDISELVVSLLDSPHASDTAREYGVNALVKLSARFKEASDVERLRRAIEKYENSLNIELQQRAVEYAILITQSSQLRKGILAKMPPPEFGEDLETQHAKAMEKALIKRRRRPNALALIKKKNAAKQAQTSDLLDLNGSENGQPLAGATTDLLNEIFGSSASNTPSASAKSASSALDGLLGGTQEQASGGAALTGLSSLSTISVPTPASRPDTIEAYANDDIVLTFFGERTSPGHARVTAYFDVKTDVNELYMNVALPKSQQLTLHPISASTLASGESATMLIDIAGPVGGNVKLRLRLSYTKDSNTFLHQFDFTKFPAPLL